MKLVIAFLFLIVILIIILKTDVFKLKHVSKKILVTAFVVKLLSAAFYFYIYTYHYTDKSKADMYRYYNDAEIMFSALKDNPKNYIKMIVGVNTSSDDILYQNYYSKMESWFRSLDDIVGNDNRTIIRLCAFFMLFTFGSIYALKLIFVLLSFIGAVWIFKTLQTDDKFKSILLFIGIFFLPSLLFWSSSISKEAFLVFTLGGFLFYFKRNILSKSLNIKDLTLLILFLLLLFTIKKYVFFALLPALIGLILLKKFRLRKFLTYATVYAIYVALLWNAQYILPNFNFVETFVQKQHDFINVAIYENAGSFFDLQKLKPDFLSFLTAIPAGYFSIFFRPFVFQTDNLLELVAGIENFIFFAFFIFTLFYADRKFKPSSEFWAKIFFVFFFFAVIGISTPVSGAVVRYKIIVYPFLISAMLSYTKNINTVKQLKCLIK